MFPEVNIRAVILETVRDPFSSAICIKQVVFLPADASASDRNSNLSLFELIAFLYALERWRSFAYPQIMVGVREDANVDFGRGNGDCRAHDDGSRVSRGGKKSGRV